MRILKKYFRETPGLFGLTYLPALLICGHASCPDSVPPDEMVKLPYVAPGTKPINAPVPRYPYQALRNRWESTMLVDMHLRRDGAVKDVKILQSTGHKVLDDAARIAFRQWRFKPGGVDHVRIPVTYSLHCAK
jgi:TonB family protein